VLSYPAYHWKNYMTSLLNNHIYLHPEVAEALAANTPVVALESTVITHGLPFPENEKLAQRLEAEIRTHGCVPATIAVLDGVICVGLEIEQIDRLSRPGEMLKISSRDLSHAVTNRNSGGTTVAGTLAVAQVAGIKVFSTGGIGGVHRQAPFDVSADLKQLAMSPLIVVCAGAKAILDIPATLEVLETYGVPVIGYRTSEFPAFYSTSSGRPVSARVDSPKEVVDLAQTHWQLGLQSAVLVAVPPPADVALDHEVIESAVQSALDEAKLKNIIGQAVTPFLLSRVSELTGGMSLQANLGLLLNNAKVGAEIAKCF
jgi:pseudouridine-5'-phosphate glycosidase